MAKASSISLTRFRVRFTALVATFSHAAAPTMKPATVVADALDPVEPGDVLREQQHQWPEEQCGDRGHSPPRAVPADEHGASRSGTRRDRSGTAERRLELGQAVAHPGDPELLGQHVDALLQVGRDGDGGPRLLSEVQLVLLLRP